MRTSGEVRFLASRLQTSTLLITTADINPQMVKMTAAKSKKEKEKKQASAEV